MIDGKPRTITNPGDAMDCRIASVQQHPELIGDFSGCENIFLGQEGARRGLFSRVGRDDLLAGGLMGVGV